MFACAAAVMFFLALIHVSALGPVSTVTLGLFFVAMHLWLQRPGWPWSRGS